MSSHASVFVTSLLIVWTSARTGRQPNKATRAGEDGKLPSFEGLEKTSRSIPTQTPGGSAFWAVKLKELLAMVESIDAGIPDHSITKTCHESSDDIKALVGSKLKTCRYPEYYFGVLVTPYTIERSQQS